MGFFLPVDAESWSFVEGCELFSGLGEGSFSCLCRAVCFQLFLPAVVVQTDSWSYSFQIRLVTRRVLILSLTPGAAAPCLLHV